MTGTVLDWGVLLCPGLECPSDNLHQGLVEVFTRDREDGPIKAVRVTDGNADFGDPTRNPSSRRQGLLIHFRCEGCGRTPVLAISQHKGQTLVEWQND